jgi:uncharacterized membrane-anchored protein YjiN (DUF445 family)
VPAPVRAVTPTPHGGPLSEPAPAPGADDALRERRLRSMKRRATGLLIGAAVTYVLTRLFEPRWPWLSWVRAAAEAAMVGGVADWFAVTALFKHPLGIPIPHTAIIPTRKDRVGLTLGRFVERNFLNKDVVAAKLRSVRVTERLARWVSEPANAHRIARHVATSVAAGIRVVRDEDVEKMIARGVETRVRETAVAPLLGRLLTLLTADNRHQGLLNEAIRLLARFVHENRDVIRSRIEAETPWWVPGAVDEKIYQKVVAGIDRTLGEIRDDPAHPMRERFDDALQDFIFKLQASPDVMVRAEKMKDDLLGADVVRQFSASIWNDAKVAIERWSENPVHDEPGSIERALVAFGQAVLADPDLMHRLDDKVVEAVQFIIERYQSEVGELIAQTVRNWDPTATSHRIELAIGRDLQFIRINGTIVGGLVGLLLHAIGVLVE